MHRGVPHPAYESPIFNLPPPQSNYGFGGGGSPSYLSVSDSLNQTRQPWIPPDISDETLRMLMGFVPVAGTVYNWDQMGPWERGLSIGMDAVDIATLGGGKLVTAPIKAGTRFATRADPSLTFLRAGDMPSTQAGRQPSNWDIYPESSYSNKLLPPQGNTIPSLNWATRQPEAGVSVYQGLQFPWDVSKAPNIYMRPIKTGKIDMSNPDDFFMQALHGPSITQGRFWDQGLFERPFYEIGGTPMKTLGSDLETLIDPATAKYIQKLRPSTEVRPMKYMDLAGKNVPPYLRSFQKGMFDELGQAGYRWHDESFQNLDRLQRQGIPKGLYAPPPPHPVEVGFKDAMELLKHPTIINPATGKPIDLASEFAKYSAAGVKAPRYRIGEIAEPWLQKPVIYPAMPTSTPGRIPMQFYGNEAGVDMYGNPIQLPVVPMGRGAVRDESYG